MSETAQRAGVSAALVTEDEAGMRLDRWFKRRFPALTLSHLAKICRKGEVRVDGKKVETSTRLEQGQTIRIPPLNLEAQEAPRPARINPDDARDIAQMTLFEDKDVMVLNKPYGLAVQGGSGTTRHIDGMLASLAEGDRRPVLVHRLDRDTSGVLLVAKNRRAAAELGEAFRSRQARKIYWALVEGVPKPSQGRISLYLAKGSGMGDERVPRKPGAGTVRDLEKMRVARHGEADAQHSLTYYAIVDKAAPRCAWLSMKPLTGRTHQLRAHAEAIGCPIVGDPKYGHRPEDEVRRRDPLRAIPEGVERKLESLKQERERLGAVNLRADEELAEVTASRDRLVSERDDLTEAIKRLRQAIQNLNQEGRERLLAAFAIVNRHFGDLFAILFEGGTAELQLIESDDPLEAGLELVVRPPGKKPQTLTLLSGGEQALTALALIFAVFLTNPSPICVLDEVDAPLDDFNVERFCDLLDEMGRRSDTRFVTITHNPITMARMDRLFGVTMAERGVSQIVSVDLAEAERFLEAG